MRRRRPTSTKVLPLGYEHRATRSSEHLPTSCWARQILTIIIIIIIIVIIIMLRRTKSHRKLFPSRWCQALRSLHDHCFWGDWDYPEDPSIYSALSSRRRARAESPPRNDRMHFLWRRFLEALKLASEPSMIRKLLRIPTERKQEESRATRHAPSRGEASNKVWA